MKKTARRTLSLVLTLVIICALAVSAFAASDFWVGECDGTTFEMLADIERYKVSTDVVTDYIYGYSRCNIDVTYTYYPMPAGSLAVTDDDSSYNTYYTNGSSDAVREESLEVDLSGSCFSMISATFNYTVGMNRIPDTYVSPGYSVEY